MRKWERQSQTGTCILCSRLNCRCIFNKEAGIIQNTASGEEEGREKIKGRRMRTRKEEIREGKRIKEKG